MADLTGTAGRSIIILAIIFILAPLRLGAQKKIAREHPEDAIIEEVFHRLIDAYDSDKPDPGISIVDKGANRGACLLDGSHTVQVERGLFDLCRKLGGDSLNGLAAVLAHELAHYYQGHYGKKSKRAKGKRWRIQSYTHKDTVLNESEADLYGGFYSLIAGYDGLDATPRLLELMYEEYGDDMGNPRYLTRDERKNLAIVIQDSLWKMRSTFRAATWLSLLRRYDEAVRCFDKTTLFFPSREIYNNSGVAYTLHAIDLISDDRARFFYPLELDGNMRLSGVTVTNGSLTREVRSPGQERLIKALLDSARYRFQKAGRIDKEYAPALINLATVNVLTDNLDSAREQASRAMRIDRSAMTQTRATTVIAIALSREGKKKESMDTLRALRSRAVNKEDVDLVMANQAVLDGGNFQKPVALHPARRQENVWGIRAKDTAVTMTPEAVDEIPEPPPLSIASKNRVRYSAIRMQGDGKWVQFIATAADYDGATAMGIRIGNGVGELVERYGAPSRVVHDRQGWYYIYDDSQIIFLIDENDNVRSWIIYDTD